MTIERMQANSSMIQTVPGRMNKSKSRKRYTIKPEAARQNKKVYLDPTVIKQMSRNFKLLCDDLMEVKSATTNNKKRQPTQTKNQCSKNSTIKNSYLSVH